MAAQLSPQMQNKLTQYQQLQQQIQALAAQKSRLEAQSRDASKALKELEKTSDEVPIYKTIGGLMVRAESKEDVVTELKDDEEALNIRIKTLERQEKQLMDRYQSLQNELNKFIGGSGQVGGS